MPAKVHNYDTRCHDGRYEVLIDGVWLSRQRAHQLRQVAKGLCPCGQPRAKGSQQCARHHLLHRLRSRRAKGCKAWKPGGKGRPPLRLPAAP